MHVITYDPRLCLQSRLMNRYDSEERSIGQESTNVHTFPPNHSGRVYGLTLETDELLNTLYHEISV